MANENTVRVHFIDGSEKIVPAKDYTVDELEVWLNEKSEDDEEDEGDGSGLHQCPYCYNLVSEEHEEFCALSPYRKGASDE